MNFGGSWNRSAEEGMSSGDEQSSGFEDRIKFVGRYVDEAFKDDSTRTYFTGDNVVGKVAGDVEKAAKYAERNPNKIPEDIRDMEGYPAAFILALSEKIEENLQ